MNSTEQQAINAITSDPTFIKTAGVLASRLHINLQDASHLLLTEVWEHRYHGLQDIASTGLTGKQERDLVFARKDLERATYNAENAHMALFTAAEDTNGNSLVEQVADTATIHTSYSEDEVSRVLALVPTIFRQRSHEFVTMLLTQGESATKEALGLSTKAFNNNIKQLTITLSEGHEARLKADRYLKSDSQIKQEENVASAINFMEMIEQEGTPVAWIQNWLWESMDNPFFDRAWDSGIKHPRAMIEQWDKTTEARQDAYTFVNAVAKMIEEGK